MTKIKDMLGFGDIVDEKIAGMKVDLYKAIKELSEMQYKIVELETKQSNTDAALKIFKEGR